MRQNPKLELLAPPRRHHDRAAIDAFHEDRVRHDLASFADAPGVLEKFVERARVRFHKSGERAILNHWTELYQTGDRMIAAKTAMERKKSEYLQLAREHEIKDTEKSASLAKLQADSEEHALRRDKAAYERQHLEEPIGTTGGSENEQKLNEAQERRQLDARWELGESLGALNTLIELQRWRRDQRNRILKDRLLSAPEQGEALQFVDDLYEQKRAELRVDTRIFEES